ncbi:MAG: Flagellar biosynthesis protein FlhB [Candidatus Tokpelaia hoelldobleri]|uniref:Flagellar biosynthetic protein FlhB n=1 Tax=Candidatus Tokpelaia hoelldobleri TaxID=1902579 RepID=A0A1U9JSU2_9HYPH|nr:MAG: Flagellar biosynthesis protein FlhB [Candidatus Tokpelaia hoelldoblerii]
MAEDKPDKDSKTEEPTEHKIRKAEEKGNLPFSRELPIFSALIAFSLIVVFLSGPAFSDLGNALRQLFDRSEDWRLSGAEDVRNLLLLVGGRIGRALAPVLVTITLAGLTASMIQHAPRFVGERIRPQLSRISLAGGFGRIFGKAGFVEFLKSCAKLIGVTLIVWLIFFRNNTVFVDILVADPASLPEFIRSQLAGLIMANAVAVVAIAGFDIAWSRINWRQQLRMTKQEIKDEYKQLEGNPLVKSRMRSLARDRTRRQMIANVPTATVIITNPTHFSVALRYTPPEDNAPIVVAKGQDLIALKIREIATGHDIPLVENVELARALYKQVEVDQTIAPEFYQAVAEIIRYVNSNAYRR